MAPAVLLPYRTPTRSPSRSPERVTAFTASGSVAPIIEVGTISAAKAIAKRTNVSAAS